MTSIQALLAALALAAGAAGCTLSEDSLTLESNARLLENEADTNLIVPAYSDDREGMAVVGDLDGDGLDDLVIGNGYYRAEGEAERMERGAVYVAYGAAGRSGDVEIGDAVLELADPFYSNQQVAVAAAGDVDGDGYDDFLATNHHFYSWCTDIAPDPDPTFDSAAPRRDLPGLRRPGAPGRDPADRRRRERDPGRSGLHRLRRRGGRPRRSSTGMDTATSPFAHGARGQSTSGAARRRIRTP